MATKITEEEKIRMNEIYSTCHNYAEVARQTGRAPSTVKKYIIPNYQPIKSVIKKEFLVEDIPEDVDLSPFIESSNLGEFCVLSEDEKEEMKLLWEEILI